MTNWPLRRVLSGGQTGADRAGLEAARRLGYETGGWAPKGWRTETGPEPGLGLLYGLLEHPSPHYRGRTRHNVWVALGTVWFGSSTSRGGSVTRAAAEEIGRPWIENPSVEELRDWICAHSIVTLNVAGNRESVSPGIYERTLAFLLEALRRPPHE